MHNTTHKQFSSKSNNLSSKNDMMVLAWNVVLNSVNRGELGISFILINHLKLKLGDRKGYEFCYRACALPLVLLDIIHYLNLFNESL